MFIFLLWLCLFIFTFILVKLLDIKKNIIICILITIFIVLFSANINLCISAALKGSKLWYNSIVPTTFPFVVICNLLIYYDGISLYSKILGPVLCTPLKLSRNCSFPLVASILCGYPLGAKYSDDLYHMDYIDRNEYLRVLNVASNVGPVFLLGSVAATMLNNIYYGYILLISNYVSILFIGIITKKSRTTLAGNPDYTCSNKKYNFGTAIKNSIENALQTVLSIGGFIIIFSVIIALIKNNNNISMFFKSTEQLFSLPENSLYALFLGSIEITNGCSIICSLNIPLNLKLAIISFLCSFSGLAIIAQVSSFVSKSNINYAKYIFLKLLQGIFSSIFTFSLTTFIPLTLSSSTLTLVHVNILFFMIPLLGLILLTIIAAFIKKLFFHVT